MSSSNGSVNGLLHEGDRVASGYEVIAHLSRGTALDVYDAWSLERDCRCVVKVVRPDRRVPRVRRRLVQEGELLLELAHPHIVRDRKSTCLNSSHSSPSRMPSSA